MGAGVSRVVVDASAMVELYSDTAQGASVEDRLLGEELHAPAHLDSEVLSALGRLHRAGAMSVTETAGRLDVVARSTVERHPLAGLLAGAWQRRDNLASSMASTPSSPISSAVSPSSPPTAELPPLTAAPS